MSKITYKEAFCLITHHNFNKIGLYGRFGDSRICCSRCNELKGCIPVRIGDKVRFGKDKAIITEVKYPLESNLRLVWIHYERASKQWYPCAYSIDKLTLPFLTRLKMRKNPFSLGES